MYNSGWLVNSPYTTLDVIESLYRNSPNHTPAYFIALSFWGQLTSYDLATGRVLTVFFALFSLAIVYRLARDFVAPIAGIFALIIVASNAFYNFYLTELRMYPLLFCAAGVVLWLYLRIVHRIQYVKNRHFVTLGAAVFVLVNVHAYSATFLLSLGIYHLAFVAKDRKWTLVSIAVCGAVILFLPWVWVSVSRGVSRATSVWTESAASSWDALAAWLAVTTNGQPLLPVISFGGLAIAVKNWRFRLAPYLILLPIFLVVLWLLTDATPLVSERTMRYQLHAWLFMVIGLSAGLFALYSYRKWLGLLVLLWPLAGVSFNMNGDWSTYIADRTFSFTVVPWQVISHKALQAEPLPHIVGYRVSQKRLEWPSKVNYSQREHYFDRVGIRIQVVNDPHEYEIYVRHNVIDSPRVWLLHKRGAPTIEELTALTDTMDDLGYELCDRFDVGINDTILDYTWEVAKCEDMQVLVSDSNSLIDYHYYGSDLDASGAKIVFADAWSRLTEDSLDHYRMSYQLVSLDWDNVAQLELPMVHSDTPRRFSIDVSEAPEGSYRLVAVVYDSRTGDRLTWATNDGYVPEMLLLD